jgi:DNA-binding CsgD family transcriptional regulator
MGAILGISALTVRNHWQRIYRTLGVSNRAHALARCLDLQLLEQ